ncbi:class I SAM-dependent methyltransferase [Candidatus Viridilinea mediisalina]|uniref:Methyltransferase type 11 domain-containing protein n=1 Tax=Candidatus Viridilinea mediisalina TaxID=2024553 RepID=A0A2A6RGG9_9CHLR|nr:class I SAM-dependent methyltransferase [Candidatus Viridilinea mediisalina]PDW02031.1 hypothetical protein CJ255_16140 [Candidatus Viridilinea mediisalina]
MKFIVKTLKKYAKQTISYPYNLVCKNEYDNQVFKRFNERAVEYSFVFRQLSRYYPMKILDVGTGTSSLPHLMRSCGFLVSSIDNIKDYWPSGLMNRHYYVINDDITNPKMQSKFDLITCVSVLEHIKNFDTAVANMLSLLNPNGYLILTFPYTDRIYIENVYKIPGSSYGQNASYICQSFSRENILNWMRDGNGEIVEQEYWRFWDGDFWTAGNQVIPPCRVEKEAKHQISCVLIRKTSRNNP